MGCLEKRRLRGDLDASLSSEKESQGNQGPVEWHKAVEVQTRYEEALIYFEGGQILEQALRQGG